MPELWLAGRIVIHELAHKVIGAEDKKYGWYGIKPGGPRLTSAQALWNADSWSYFAADMAGAIPAVSFREAYREPAR